MYMMEKLNQEEANMRVAPPWETKKRVMIRVEEGTDPSYGQPPESRPIQDHIRYGVVNLDKPPGPTSHEVVSWVKRILNIDRAGHSGTLDPRVTGVLPITLVEATKVSQILLLSGKEYVCVMRLHAPADEERVVEVLEEFVGEIYQRPPLRSSVRRRVRRRRMYYITDLEFDGDYVLFRVGCQAGTYVRKLCFDVGEALGCGAHMEELRRTRAGPFTEDEGLASLYDLSDGYAIWREEGDESLLRRFVHPVERALELVPKIFVRDSAVDALCHGADLAVPGVVRLEGDVLPRRRVGIFTLKGELVALARALMSAEEIVEGEHGIAADTERVIMPVGVYPRRWRGRKSG